MKIIITERQLQEINRFQMKDDPKYRGCLMSDLTRMELIDNFLQKVDEDSEYNTEEPDYDMLLDDWDGYDDQVYIQNKDESIVFWEGWVDSCWKAAFQKEQYKGLKKSKVINKIIEERFPRIAEEFDMEIIDYGYIDNDGYIMYIEMKKKYMNINDIVTEKEMIPIDTKNVYEIISISKSGKMPLDKLRVMTMVDKLKNGGTLPPIKVNNENKLIDGHHRYMAYKIANISKIPFVRL